MRNLLMVTGLGSARDLASGKEGAFYQTLAELHTYWDRIDIIAPRISSEREKVLFGNVHIHISPWPLLLHPVFFIRKGRELYQRHKFSLMAVHEFPPFYNGIGARILSHLTGVPYVLEIHHIPGFPKAANTKERFYRWLCRWFLAWDAHTARAVRVVNQNQVPKFLQACGVPARKIKYIPSMYIDTNIFRPMPEIPKEYDLVYAGRLVENKGTLLLLKALAILNQTRPTSLLIIGSGPERKKIDRYIAAHGLSKQVTFAGWLNGPEEVARALSSAKIFVNPSFNEGGPRVAVEAMACGLPAVTTRVGLMPDIIRDGENGFFCSWNPTEMARTIEKALDASSFVSAASRETVQQFEKKASVRNYAESLRRLSHSRLLVITKKADQHDQLLGFFVEWLRRLAQQLAVSVLCLERGPINLPNVEIASMGKDRGVSKLGQLMNFYHYIMHRHDEYDAVFVHMSPVWAVLGGWYWRLRGKKIILWYTSGGVTLKLRIAAAFADVILTASPESFRLKSDKVIVTGHGIDTEMFRPGLPLASDRLRILTVGRINPTKNYEVLIEALAEIKLPIHLTIVGDTALPSDVRYKEKIITMIHEHGLDHQVTFAGVVDHDRMPEIYQSHNLFVHMSKTGSLDKVLLEAMASGIAVLSCNDTARNFLNPQDLFDANNPHELAQKISNFVHHPHRRHSYCQYVLEHHSLDSLIKKITSMVN